MNNSVIKKEGIELVCDFHVHTPASQCYKNKDIDYIEIINTAITKGLNTICITDHNTILGYIKIIEEIAELKNEYAVLSKYEKYTEEQIKLAQKIEKIEKINIIPGIELTTDPGIHIILLFDPNKKIDEILEFLKKLDIDGSRITNDDYIVNQTILTVLEMAKNFGCITIAPHIDSDKGVYRELENLGSLRAKIFSSSNLDAMTCNNAKVESKIRMLTTTDDKYKRNIPLAVVYGSDAHNLKDIAKKKTFIKYNKNDNVFSIIKYTMLQHMNCISNIEKIEIHQKIKKYIDYGLFICIKDFDKELITQSLCAMLNNMFGSILIGLGKNNEIIGIESTKEELLTEINNIFNEPGSILKNCLKDIEILELSDECLIVIINVVNVFDKLYGIQNDAYFYNSIDKTIYKPTIEELEKYLKNKFFNRLEYIQNRNSVYQTSIIENLEMISKPFYQMSLHNKLVNKGVLFLQTVDNIYVVENLENLNISPGNGDIQGKFYYTTDIDVRIDDAILRYSCPVEKQMEDIEEVNRYEPGEYIVMKKSGASFYINSINEWYYASKENSDIIINSSNLNLKILLAWLKSSFFIFYCFFDEKIDDVTDVNMIPRLFIPDFSHLSLEDKEKLECIVNDILQLENQYLNNELSLKFKFDSKEIDKKEYIEAFTNLTKEHNGKVAELTMNIDYIFKQLLNITSEERNYVSHCIKQKGLYDLYSN